MMGHKDVKTPEICTHVKIRLRARLRRDTSAFAQGYGVASRGEMILHVSVRVGLAVACDFSYSI